MTLLDKQYFKKQLIELLSRDVYTLNDSEKIAYIKAILVELEKDKEYDKSNKGNAWSDDELRLILQMQPTADNIVRLAKAFKRGYGSIEQIYRWAAEDQKSINQKRSDDKFVKQIKRIASEVGWRAS